MYRKFRKKIAQKFPELRYWADCIMNCKSEKFRQSVIALANYPGVFFFEKYGKLNPDKNICIVGMDDNYITQGGLMSEIRNLLVRFAMCEHYGFTPVVEFRDSLYSMETPVNGTTNAYEYFFEQPTTVSLSEAWNSQYVYVSRGIDALEFADLNQNYDISDDQITKMGELFRKYIRIKTSVESIIQTQIDQLLLQKKTLGVHIRGGDFNQLYEGHPIPVTPEEYIDPIKKLLVSGEYEQIFLATDDQEAIDILKDAFKEKLLYYDNVSRTDDGTGVHTTGFRTGKNGYQMGIEVLTDTYCLANCDGLITGYSGAGLMAQIIKCAKGQKYSQKVILSNGFCNNGNVFPQRKRSKK